MNITRRKFFASASALALLALVPIPVPSFPEPTVTLIGVDLTAAPRNWFVNPDAFYLDEKHNDGTSWGKAARSLDDIANRIEPKDTVFVTNAIFDYGDGDIVIPPYRHIQFTGCKFHIV